MPAPTVVIMAAGHGTRMRSSVPKVLHPLCGLPLVEWVIAAARAAGASRVICVTRPDSGVAEALGDSVEVVEQREGEGTGAAVLAARGALDGASPVVVLSGDHPLVSAELVAGLVATHEQEAAAATLLTTDQLDPTGYGRVVRDHDGHVERIVETKHTEGVPPEELAIREVNIGTYAFSPTPMLEALDAVGEDRGERYLTGVFPVLRERGLPIAAHLTRDTLSAMGVNTRVDLMNVERIARRALVDTHALNGVGFEAPQSTCIDAGVEIGEDTVIGAGVTLRAGTVIGRGCRIGPQTTIEGARIGDAVRVLHSFLHDCDVEAEASIGPFAYLRPGTRVGRGAKIGTFVEVKNSTIGAGAKVPHLSYIGDADIGEEANVAAGNITANYDGRRKHRTVIGKRAKTGVHTSYVAPVRVGDEAYTGAGSVINDDVPDGALGISRPREQTNVEGYAKRVEEESGS
jgi:bifunctional UDP-N-acetylglucosamine pyrophosphorylase / glucosamine-1-phosphate N-acetyltransferase